MTDFSTSVPAALDDGYGHTDGSSLTTGANYALVGQVFGSLYRGYFRFTNVTIPAGSTITSAILRCTSETNQSGTNVYLNVAFEAADDPARPSNGTDLIGRTLTTSVIAWDGLGAWTTGNTYDTPDLAASLQEVIDRPGWASGQAIQAHIIDDGSDSTTAYRHIAGYESTRDQVELIVSYVDDFDKEITESFSVDDSIDAELPDVGDNVESFSVNDYIDGLVITPAITESFSVGDAINADFESAGALDESFSVGDAIEGFIEFAKDFDESFGVDDQVDAFNYSAWLRQNKAIAKQRYFFTLTGAPDLLTDIEIPISSIYARKQYDGTTFLQVVIPGWDYQAEIANRPNGVMKIDTGFEVGGVISLRETLLEVDIEEVRPDKGADSRSITLSGRRAVTYPKQIVTLDIAESIYYSFQNRQKVYRFATVDPYLNPGDTVTVDTDIFTVASVVYIIGDARNSMEIREGAV